MEPLYLFLHTVDSTMSYAKQGVHSGAITTDTIITAERQLSGKGRWGRQWNSPGGNLYYTRVMEENASLAPFSYCQLGALATLSTVRELGCQKALLKWPNDILVEKKKLAGILVERFFHKERAWVSTGIGMNVLMQKECPDLKATSLSLLLKKPPSMAHILSSLARSHTQWMQWALHNSSMLTQKWKEELFWMKGTCIQTHRQEITLSGVVHDFYEDGSILLTLEDGSRKKLMPEWIDTKSDK